ncbi:hypothetical protein ACH5RR_019759 [Cinchona calisaya]|uniref:Uncharacterized protein n=1 Tax=Cinchona calisaya TaxID=153742 RepID=A0ABD2ZTV9_9GENT
MSTFSEEPELKEFMDFIDNLNNYEKAGVPKGAGTDSDDGFDLGRMRRLMQLLGNPRCKFKNRLFTLLGQREKGQRLHFSPTFYGHEVIQWVVILVHT